MRRFKTIARVLCVASVVVVLFATSEGRADNGVTETSTGPVGYYPVTSSTPLFNSTLTNTASTDLEVVPANSSQTVTSAVFQVKVSTGTNDYVGSFNIWAKGATEPTVNAGRFVKGDTVVMVSSKTDSDGKATIKNYATGYPTYPTPYPPAYTVTLIGYYATQDTNWPAPPGDRYLQSTMYTIWDTTSSPLQANTTGNGTWVPIAGQYDIPSNARSVTLRMSIFPVRTEFSPDSTNIRSIYIKRNENPESLREIQFRENGDRDENGQLLQEGDSPMSHVAAIDLNQSSNPGSVYVDFDGEALANNTGGQAAFRLDLAGYIDNNGAFQRVVKPVRTFPISAGATVTGDIRGVDGVPARSSCTDALQYPNSCAKAVQLSITRKDNDPANPGDTTSAGILSINGIDVLAVAPDRSTANTAIVPIPDDGELDWHWTGTTSASFSVEVKGWFEFNYYDPHRQGLAARYTAIAPTLLYGSWWCCESANWNANLQVAGSAGIPANGASHVMLQVSIWWAPNGAADMTAWPSGRDQPLVPNLSVSKDSAAVATVLTEVGRDGKVSVKVDGAAVAVTVSVLGWMTPYVGTSTAGDQLDVAVIGDSITWQSQNLVHTTLRPNNDVSVMGVSGALARQQLWWADLISGSRPAWTIANLGTNDALFGPSSPGTNAKESLTALTNSMQATGSSNCTYIVTVNDTGGERQLDSGATTQEQTDALTYISKARDVNARTAELDDSSDKVGRIDWSNYVHRFHERYDHAIVDTNGEDGDATTAPLLSALPPASYDGVHLWYHDYRSETPRDANVYLAALYQRALATADNTNDLEKYITRCGPAIKGIVTKNGSTTPARDVIVNLYDTNGTIVRTGITDAAGRYSIGGLATGNYRIGFTASSDFPRSESQGIIDAYYSTTNSQGVSTLGAASTVTVPESSGATRNIQLTQ